MTPSAIAIALLFLSLFVLMAYCTTARLKLRILWDRLTQPSRDRIALPPENITPRRSELTFIIVVPLCLGVAAVLGEYLCLFIMYGVPRVLREGLHVVQMRRGRPWIVSNGDLFDDTLQDLHFVLVGAIWIILTFAVFAVLDKVGRKRKSRIHNEAVTLH